MRLAFIYHNIYYHIFLKSKLSKQQIDSKNTHIHDLDLHLFFLTRTRARPTHTYKYNLKI